MDEEAAFLLAIVEHPGEDEYRLVFADWLEERGDPRAEWVRLHLEYFRLFAGSATPVRSKKIYVLQKRLGKLRKQFPHQHAWWSSLERGWQIQFPFLDLILAAETVCNIDCCGIDALELTEANVTRWVAGAGTIAAQQALLQIHTLLEKIKASKVPLAAQLLNHSFTVAQSITWLGQWQKLLERVLKSSGAEP